MSGLVYLHPPADFKPTVQVASCFCEADHKILFLKRMAHKPHGQKWCLPGGKLEKGETPRQAAIREIAEEVGLNIRSGIKKVGKIYIDFDQIQYVFHMFAYHFTKTPPIILEEGAHEEARWVTLGEAFDLPLIIGGKEILDIYKTWRRS